MNVAWSNSLGKVGFFGLCRIQTLKVSYMSYLDKVFESFTNKIQSFRRFKNFWRFRPSGAIELIRKDGKDGKLPIWLNPKLFYSSVFFETVDYVFCLKELL